MSSNNYLLIIKTPKGKYVVEERDVDTGSSYTFHDFGEQETLEKCIEIANRYMEENEVEYGLEIKL